MVYLTTFLAALRARATIADLLFRRVRPTKRWMTASAQYRRRAIGPIHSEEGSRHHSRDMRSCTQDVRGSLTAPQVGPVHTIHHVLVRVRSYTTLYAGLHSVRSMSMPDKIWLYDVFTIPLQLDHKRWQGETASAFAPLHAHCGSRSSRLWCASMAREGESWGQVHLQQIPRSSPFSKHMMQEMIEKEQI